jgi:uncharacterized cupredoxin-like copper-binding protein
MRISTNLRECALLGASLAMLATAVPLASADERILVTLADKGMDSMRMDLSANQIRTGKVIFNVTNSSQSLVHEFVVAKLDKPVELLPYNEEDKELKEDAVEVVNEIENIEPGKTGTLTVSLQPGSYILFCNKTGHFKAGMFHHLTVVK